MGDFLELPSLGNCFDSLELDIDFVYVNSTEGWFYPAPWVNGIDDRGGFFSDGLPAPAESVISSSFESLLWD